jgi:hypothetical protein
VSERRLIVGQCVVRAKKAVSALKKKDPAAVFR